MTAQQRRQWIHYPMLFFWLVPGGVASILWRESLIWIVFMSWFAIVYTVVAAVSGETPAEVEGEE